MPQHLIKDHQDTIQDDDDPNGLAYDMDDYNPDTHGTNVPFC